MTIEELEQIAESVRLENAKFDHEINVCMGTGCLSQHSDKLRDALAKAVEASGKKALVRRTGCMGLCAAGPLVLVDPEETLYGHMRCRATPEKVVNQLGGEPVGIAAVRSARAFRSAGPRGAGELRPHRSRRRLTTISPATDTRRW